jgi:hypothetical protein
MISSHVTYEVGRARIDDLRSQADERRRAVREPEAPLQAARVGQRRHRSSQPLHALRLRRA